MKTTVTFRCGTLMTCYRRGTSGPRGNRTWPRYRDLLPRGAARCASSGSPPTPSRPAPLHLEACDIVALARIDVPAMVPEHLGDVLPQPPARPPPALHTPCVRGVGAPAPLLPPPSLRVARDLRHSGRVERPQRVHHLADGVPEARHMGGNVVRTGHCCAISVCGCARPGVELRDQLLQSRNLGDEPCRVAEALSGYGTHCDRQAIVLDRRPPLPLPRAGDHLGLPRVTPRSFRAELSGVVPDGVCLVVRPPSEVTHPSQE